VTDGKVRLAGKAACAVAEALLTPRSLSLLFLLVAATLAAAGWLRPPLSQDISSLHLSLGVWNHAAEPGAVLYGPRRIPPDSAGLLLLGLLAGGAVVVLLRPRTFPVVAGVLLSAALAANAAVALNHPALIEMLEREREQRQRIVLLLGLSPMPTPLSRLDNGRIGLKPEIAAADSSWSDPTRGWDYLLYGCWLVGWAALGVWFGGRGSLWRRCKILAGWGALGLVLGGALCLPRLRAEYHWVEANRREYRGEWEGSRQALSTAIQLFPEFDRMERTWLLLGKLDHLQSRATSAEQLFRASQLALKKEPPLLQRIQSELAGFTPVVSGAEPAEPPDAIFPFIPGYGSGHAFALLETLLAQDAEAHPVVRTLAARILTDMGSGFYLRKVRFTDAGPDYSRQKLHLMAVQEAWRRALQLEPARIDSLFFLGYTQASIDRDHPEIADAILNPLLNRLADRLVCADLLNILGDAYFAAGRITEARERYAESLDLLNLPQRKNFRAQKGLGGL
jgi:tetratricopeptide (TPR) repeat protein